MIPVTVWGLNQPTEDQKFVTDLRRSIVPGYLLVSANKTETFTVSMRLMTQVQDIILKNNKNPNVQVIILDSKDLESTDFDLFKSACTNLAYFSFYSSKTYVIFCDLTRTNLTDEQQGLIEISDKINRDLRRLVIHWPGRCYYEDLGQVVNSQDWLDQETLTQAGQEKLAKAVTRILLGTPCEVFI